MWTSRSWWTATWACTRFARRGFLSKRPAASFQRAEISAKARFRSEDWPFEFDQRQECDILRMDRSSSMVAEIMLRKTELIELCRLHHVRRLEVFGSAAGSA